ncbi:MAG TPA: lysophospholipid acyltransferase family protein [Anaerolineales bacterium]|jgi:1-acyl-sn-glycerol-3-phosphate acyltransferase
MVIRSLGKEGTGKEGYFHERWRTKRRFLRFLLKTIAFSSLVKIERVEGLQNIPKTGSAILFFNHIAFVDPIVMVYVVPRDIVPLAKIEVYDYPIIGIFPQLWGVIPVRREEVDRRAIKRALDVLAAGEILLVAPEGTRNDELQPGKEGLAYLASRSGAPVLPVMMEGTPGFPALPFSKRWRQPGVHVRFGRPFHYRPELKRAGRDLLSKMLDEAMYRLAAIIPENRRGVYSDLSRATQDTLEIL